MKRPAITISIIVIVIIICYLLLDWYVTGGIFAGIAGELNNLDILVTNFLALVAPTDHLSE